MRSVEKGREEREKKKKKKKKEEGMKILFVRALGAISMIDFLP